MEVGCYSGGNVKSQTESEMGALWKREGEHGCKERDERNRQMKNEIGRKEDKPGIIKMFKCTYVSVIYNTFL